MKIGNRDFYDGEYFKVMYRSGHGWLNTNPADEQSIEACRAAIDRRNAWAQGNSAATDAGIRPEQFMIVKHIWNKSYFLDGTFMESNEKCMFIELYPHDI